MTNPPNPEDPQQPGTPPVPQYPAPQFAMPQSGSQIPQQYPAFQASQAPYYPPSFGAPGPGEPFNGAASPEDLSRPLYGATFSQAVRRFFKNYANFSGRASRSEYWWTGLFVVLVLTVASVLWMIGLFIATASSVSTYDSYNSSYETSAISDALSLALIAGGGLWLLISLGLVVPSLAISWRRLHDANFAGPMYFLNFIPSAGSLVILVFMILPSNIEGRRFDRN